MIHYAVTINGKVVGSRSSKSARTYTHALVISRTRDEYSVVSYHSTERLALAARHTWSHLNGALSVVPVAVTARRAKVGDLVVPQGVL